MSCRVLGRKVEHMVLREILGHARVAGIHKLIGSLPAHGSQQAGGGPLAEARIHEGRRRAIWIDDLGIACRGDRT